MTDFKHNSDINYIYGDRYIFYTNIIKVKENEQGR